MKKLIILTDFFPPAFKAGGPVRSVSNLVEQLKNEFEILVVTGDRDLGDSKGFEDEEKNEILQKEGFKVIFLSPENRSLKHLEALVEKFDPQVVYLNSLFSGSFTVKPLFKSKRIFKNKKIVLAPRGMLHGSALSKKKTKKRIFLRLAKLINLYGNVVWHATSKEEKERIIQEFGSENEVKVIPNLPGLLQPREQISKSAGSLKMMFYGRLSVEKNLLGGLNILRNSSLEDVSLHIYGPKEDIKYWGDCEREIELIKKESPGLKIEYCNIIHPESLQSTMENYNVLFSPSGSENFGHAIVEAMSSGMPALISDKTPWSELESFSAGKDIPLDSTNKWIEAIEFFKALNKEEFKTWSQGAIKYSREIMTDKNAQQAYLELFS